MRMLRLRWKHWFPDTALPLLAILVLFGICGCGRNEHPPSPDRSIPASPESTPGSAPSDSPDGGRDKPEEDATSHQPPPSAGAVAEVDPSSPSRSEESDIAPRVAETETRQPTPGKSNLGPVDALKALGATVKTNVRGDVISVDLKETQVTDAHLSHLRKMTEIKTLNLSQTPITDEGLSHLEGLTNLNCLYLFGTDVTDVGLKHLIGLTRIEVLCLDDTRITDAGLVHLKNMTQLETLHIQSKETITDAGLELLTEMTRLKELRIGGTDVTEEGVTKLKQSLPDCQVVR